MGQYTYPQFPYKSTTDLSAQSGKRHPLVIVGAGPVGLAAAIDARLQGLDVLLFDEDDSVSVGSRAVCYAKRALEVLDRLGVGDPLCEKGVSWNIGRTFLQEEEVYRFNLVPDVGHKRPGMINLQQYYLEETLVSRARELGADFLGLIGVAGDEGLVELLFQKDFAFGNFALVERVQLGEPGLLRGCEGAARRRGRRSTWHFRASATTTRLRSD